MRQLIAGLMAAALCACFARAQEVSPERGPTPLGVFGASLLPTGQWTVSVAGGLMKSAGSLVGTRWISPQETVLVAPWFFNPTLPTRLVPLHQHVSTQTVNLGYGYHERLTLFLSLGMIEKTLDATTFYGSRGLVELPKSYTGAAGLADAAAAAIVALYRDDVHHLNVNFGLSLPTGGINNTFALRGSDGAYATTRAFYGMQPGAGTIDLMPGLTYSGDKGAWSWGAAYRGHLPVAGNRNGYLWGDLHEVSIWGGYDFLPGVTGTLRIAAIRQGPIRGFDQEMRGRAQSANPHNYGGRRVDIFGGATIKGEVFGVDDWSLAVEAGVPIFQALNGPQIARAFQATVALKRAM